MPRRQGREKTNGSSAIDRGAIGSGTAIAERGVGDVVARARHRAEHPVGRVQPLSSRPLATRPGVTAAGPRRCRRPRDTACCRRCRSRPRTAASPPRPRPRPHRSIARVTREVVGVAARVGDRAERQRAETGLGVFVLPMTSAPRVASVRRPSRRRGRRRVGVDPRAVPVGSPSTSSRSFNRGRRPCRSPTSSPRATAASASRARASASDSGTIVTIAATAGCAPRSAEVRAHDLFGGELAGPDAGGELARAPSVQGLVGGGHERISVLSRSATGRATSMS